MAIEHLGEEGKKAWPLMAICWHLSLAPSHPLFFQPHANLPHLLFQALETEEGRQVGDIAAGVEIKALCGPAKKKLHMLWQHLTCIASQIKWLDVMRPLHVAVLHDF